MSRQYGSTYVPLAFFSDHKIAMYDASPMIHAIHFFFSDASYNMYDRKNTTVYSDTIVYSVC